MARKLKVYQTSEGFYDLAVAAPSMKAALEAWGAGSNLFHQGFAKESDDDKASQQRWKSPASSCSGPSDLTPHSRNIPVANSCITRLEPARGEREPVESGSRKVREG